MSKLVEINVVLVIFLLIFFSCFLLLFKAGNRWSKKLLGLFFFCLALSITDIYLQVNGTYIRFPQYAFLLNAVPLLFGPLLWLFTQSVINNQEKMNRSAIKHFIPFLLFFIGFIFFYHIHDLDYKKEFIQHAYATSWQQTIGSMLFVVLLICPYIFKSYKAIRTYRVEIKKAVSNVDKINLEWLELTLLGFGFLILGVFMIQGASILLQEQTIHIFLFLVLNGSLIYIMSVLVKGLKTGLVFQPIIEEKTTQLKVDTVKVYGGTLKEIKEHMATKQPFLDASLTLKGLAEQLDLPSRELSTLINRGEGRSFFDFVNHYRIDYAKQSILASKDEKITILEIMYASGFNSKSSFNTAFKKHSGYTPTQWKEINT